MITLNLENLPVLSKKNSNVNQMFPFLFAFKFLLEHDLFQNIKRKR